MLLQGCSLLPGRGDAAAEADASASAVQADAPGSAPAPENHAFSVEVLADDDELRELLEKHLELQRYRQLDDLELAEVSRLMVAAEANARQLLATQGYFTPALTLELQDRPEDRKAPHRIVVRVQPGERTQVEAVQVDFAGPITSDEDARVQRELIRSGWSLAPGQVFTQQSWDNAKTVGLRALTARRFPTGSVQFSRADIDADRSRARLSVTYHSGPAYRFGALQLRGAERYDADGARRIARVPTGEVYDQQKLLDAQQRLASSGYYDSVFLTLDTEQGLPTFAPVIAQVREAPYQKVVLGVGFTTDNGPRVSVDHIHNRMPLLGWRAVSKLSVERDTQVLNTTWTSLPGESGWRWGALGELKKEQAGTYDVNSGRVRYGLSKAGDHIDYATFLQYDYAENVGESAPPSASALSVNWHWTGRYFDDAGAPRRGWGLALELGAGYALSGQRLPFTRAYARWLGVVPLGRAEPGEGSLDARRSRLALRAELGGVVAKDSARIPSTLLFLTGGDTSVRGYSYRQIGTLDAVGATVAGRYMAVASVEWQRPVVWNGKRTDWESVAFVDAGAVADKANALNKFKVGVGVGARWASPVGPVQADLAYGVDVKKFRLHLRLGFSF
ncbi:autotransporter assembly complex protein TamA [Xenophilus arseniciresistens]|uniref:Translocation and assembly module subunit TamA n=1 Tax=Xenophilus arseniciresistens TaxID=1283306 RepID=A0AAE3N5V3_9BURK|nr:autotransporter assembly complex family protein [Xenophilus arseniciresistens]MDA7415428.1 autotransporter assembly complex protein TamA [Xenophilus arseniciresistens]